MTNDPPPDAPAPVRGVFITFEGGEGAGKSTQVTRLAAALRTETGREVITTREPGGTARAEAIREAVLTGVAKPYGPFAEALMFAGARIDHLDRLIRPALADGAVVLCDRFADSTRAYQGAAGGVSEGVLRALERVVVGPTRPDLTLILDLPAQVGLDRARARAAQQALSGRGRGPHATGPHATGRPAEADRFEAEALDFHESLRAAFRAIAASEPARCVLIDASLDAEAVEAAIRDAVAARLPALAPNRAEPSGAGRENAA